MHYSACILKKKEINHSIYLTCKSEVILDQQLHSILYTSLIKNSNSTGLINVKNVYLNSKKIERLTSFIPKQILEFSRWSGDPNSIHYGDKPIVQGMLILLTLEDYLISNNIKISKGDIKYISPIRAYEDISISHKEKTILGVVKNKLCFVLKYEEDKNCLEN